MHNTRTCLQYLYDCDVLHKMGNLKVSIMHRSSWVHCCKLDLYRVYMHVKMYSPSYKLLAIANCV